MSDFTDSYQVLHQEVIESTKELKKNSEDLAKTLYGMSKHLENISELHRMIKNDRLHELFAWISKMVTGTGNHIIWQSELFKGYLGSHLKYHMWEHEGLRELHKTREEVKTGFMKKEKSLFDQKEKLFKNRDLTKWKFTAGSMDELMRRQ
jgi:hypothetical protein